MASFTFTGPYGDIECVVNNYKLNDVVLIMAHGFRGSRDGGGRSTAFAKLAEGVCKVVRFNFNGSQILSRQVEELQAVIAAVREQYNPEKLFLLGRSLGGAASMVTASRDENIDGLILWATPNDLRKTFLSALGDELYKQLDAGETLHLEDERGKMDLTPDFLTDLDKYNLTEIMSKWQDRPLLILHGEQDVTVDVAQGRKNFELAGGDKEIYIFANGDHTFSECATGANAQIVKWLYSRT